MKINLIRKKIRKQEKGITLVALVVTIVVLLILAGVSLNLVLGENGIITKAQEAREKTEQARINTEKSMNSLEQELSNYIKQTNSEKEESTVTVLGYEAPNSVAYDESYNVSVTAKKSKPEEKLKFIYKFYNAKYIGEGWDYSSFEYCENKDIIDVTSDSKSSITVPPASGSYGTKCLIKCIITDINGVEKANVKLLNYENGYTLDVYCLAAGTVITVEEEEEDEKGRKKRVRKKKKIEDLTYNDRLLAWDFDNGCFTTAKPLWLKRREETEEYNLLKFSDGSQLKTIKQHRIFNKELGKFTYPMTDETPIGTTTFTEDGKEVKLISKEVIKEHVDFYNVITYYHMNAFANGILTSCRLSNLYKIKDMKYIKDDRKLASREEYKQIPDNYFYGMRISEQPKNINNGNDVKIANSLTEYVNNCISNQK